MWNPSKKDYQILWKVFLHYFSEFFRENIQSVIKQIASINLLSAKKKYKNNHTIYFLSEKYVQAALVVKYSSYLQNENMTLLEKQRIG